MIEIFKNREIKLKDFLYVFIFDTIIALFLTLTQFDGSFIKNFTDNFIFSHCIGTLCAICTSLASRFTKTFSPITRLIAIILAMIAAIISGILIGATLIGINIFTYINEYSKSFTQSIIISIFFASIIAYIFISREKITIAKSQILEEKLKNISNEKNILETNIRLLHAQIEPHFLFNTLSTILNLMDSDTKNAKTMLENFTNLLRASYSKTIDKTTSIFDELELIKNYINIFKVRMGNRLNFKINIPDNLIQYSIPSMLIQPMVENAIKHGIEPKIEGGEILVKINTNADKLYIAVIDTGIGFKINNKSNGVALSNIKKRLELLFGDKARLILEENKPAGVKSIIEIPYETNKSNNS
ncbi:histidine kinase [Candidatus Desantisbacteria bacterium]|nr:histidine kinase [Candidatus Desantisbacteria bacterium]